MCPLQYSAMKDTKHFCQTELIYVEATLCKINCTFRGITACHLAMLLKGELCTNKSDLQFPVSQVLSCTHDREHLQKL